MEINKNKLIQGKKRRSMMKSKRNKRMKKRMRMMPNLKQRKKRRQGSERCSKQGKKSAQAGTFTYPGNKNMHLFLRRSKVILMNA